MNSSVTPETDLVVEPGSPAAADLPELPAAPASDFPPAIIEPRSGWRLVDVRELWRYRELLYFLTLRDVKVRYKQTLLGAAWAVIQPFMMMVVFTIFLGRMAKVSSGDFPYPVFVYAGLLPWSFFSTAISNAGHSVVGSERLITKIYFPRLAVPFASVGAAIADFFIAFSVLLGMMLWYGIAPGWSILLVPLLIFMVALTALGVGAMLAALNVAYRDFRYVIPFLVQLWMFATPTVYMSMESASAPEKAVAQSEVAQSEKAATGESEGVAAAQGAPSQASPAGKHWAKGSFLTGFRESSISIR
jgi:lipopolysaccharide transport system permease protein